MAVTNAQIHGALMPRPLKHILIAINDTTATDTDISAALVSLDEKAILRQLKASTATRVSILGGNCDPAFERLALDMAGV